MAEGWELVYQDWIAMGFCRRNSSAFERKYLHIMFILLKAPSHPSKANNQQVLIPHHKKPECYVICSQKHTSVIENRTLHIFLLLGTGR